MASLAEIRAKLQAIESRRSGKSFSGSNDKTNFPFWNMQADTQSVIRFLPDKNEENVFFWIEKQMIKIPFPGVKNGGSDFPEDKQVLIQVPCVDTWAKNTCPVMREIGPWWDDESLVDLARVYWKKRSYIFQGIVRENGLGNEDLPENPIRKFVLGPQIYKIVKAALMDDEMVESPTDYEAGTDFKIFKQVKGSGAKSYNDYTSSGWARRESALTEEEREAVDKFGLVDLSTYLPKQPTEELTNIIFQMFEQSVEGALYDPKLFGAHYKPWGLEYNPPEKTSVQVPAGTEDSVSEKSVYTPVVEKSEDAPVAEKQIAEPAVEAKEPELAEGDAPTAQDILARIRNRDQ